jgi:hypothetical protein
MADIETDKVDAWKMMDLARGDEFFDSEYDASRTLLDRIRQSPINKTKVAIQTKVTDVVQALDTELKIYAEANSKWLVEGVICAVGESANGDLDYSICGPTGCGGWFNTSIDNAKNAVTVVGSATEITQALTSTPVLLPIRAYVTVGSTAGFIGLSWAQNASHADDVSIDVGSFLTFMRAETS